jgi:uncharacterized protein (DUF4415 family)
MYNKSEIFLIPIKTHETSQSTMGYRWPEPPILIGETASVCEKPINERKNAMPKLKPGTILVTDEEEARIQAGIDADPDVYSLTDKEWERVKHTVRIGRPPSEVTKERITIRLSRDVVTQFRATGSGWQTRIDAALRQFIEEHPIAH